MAYEGNMMHVDMEDEASARLLHAVVGYEAASRGLTRGQAIYELVLKAVKVWQYPADVRSRISEAERSRLERAVRESLAASGGSEVA